MEILKVPLWRAVIALAMFVVIDAEILIVDPARAEAAMHEGSIGFCWILQSRAERIQPEAAKERHFFYWHGIHQRLYNSEPELINEVLSNKFGYYGKKTHMPLVLSLLGCGLILVD